MGSAPPAREVVIGVLELQGAFAEHTSMLRRVGATKVVGVRLPEHLENLDGLVLPGGESTTQSKLLVDLNMLPRVIELVKAGLPILGTCAGAILLARDIVQRPEQPRIGVLNVAVDRNAYGTQINSFEADVIANEPTFASKPMHIVQIRAPAIVEVGKGVKVLAKHGNTAVLVRQANILAATFHPELTNDTRLHEYFYHLVRQHANSSTVQPMSL